MLSVSLLSDASTDPSKPIYTSITDNIYQTLWGAGTQKKKKKKKKVIYLITS